MLAESSLNRIAQRIKERRLELGLSLQNVATLTGMSKSTLQRYESGGIRNIPLQRLESLSNALQTTPEIIMGIKTNTIYTNLIELYKESPNFGPLPNPEDAIKQLEKNQELLLPVNFDIGAFHTAYLSSEEEIIILVYRMFKKEGRDKIRAYIGDLSDNPDYATPELIEDGKQGKRK